VLQYKHKGQRNIGRPRKRWRDQIHLEDQGTGKRLILHEYDDVDDDDDVRLCAYSLRHAQCYVVQCVTSYFDSVLPIQLFCFSYHRSRSRDAATVCAVTKQINSDIVMSSDTNCPRSI
jgi:hypothetical protein